MSRYTFTFLSPHDFEELVRDLLQVEWNVAIEAFKTGRDGGIDLRYASAHDGTTIVQCKHYAVSGYSKLLSHLRNVDLPKITRLSSARYVVATSEGLTPANKDEIVAAMQPFIRSTGDVLGAQDLEGLLSRHPSVEKANFKLWLTSTAVLERVLHNAEQCHTDFEVERIRRKLGRGREHFDRQPLSPLGSEALRFHGSPALRFPVARAAAGPHRSHHAHGADL
jgi:hypothetical protein